MGVEACRSGHAGVEQRVENGPKVIATAFALAGFTVALIAGMGAGNPAAGVLAKAIVSMVVCSLIGQIVGGVALRAVSDHLGEYRATNPIPELSTGSQPDEQTSDAAGGKSP